MKLSNISEKSKILIIRLSSMGDIILTTAFVRQLRKKFPHARIDYLVAKQFAEILKYNPHLDNVFEYDKNADNEEIGRLKTSISADIGRYDYIIDLQKNIRSIRFRRNLGEKVLSIKKHRLHKLSLVYFKKPLIHKHVAENYFDTAEPLGIIDDNDGLEIWLKGEKKYEKNYHNDIDKLKISIAPGAHFPTKRWPAARFCDLIKKIKIKYNAHLRLIGGREDEKIAHEIENSLNFEVDNYVGKLSILGSTEAISQSDIVITNDSGALHIASARRKPVLAFFGSTVTQLGFSPWRVPHEIAEVDINCRPCSHIGRKSCPKGHFKCMNEISSDFAFKKFELLLKKYEEK